MTTTTGTLSHDRSAACNYQQGISTGCTASRHGTRSAYSAGCRCPEARAANTRYRTRLIRRHAHIRAGAAHPLTVPAADVRAVLEQLLGTGWTRHRIAAATGIGRSRISRITGGTGRPITHVHWHTYVALRDLLEQDPVVAGATLVDAYDTWQRLRGLIALGYPKTWIAQQLGLGRALQLDEHRILKRNADKVATLVDTYGATPGPSNRARAYAAAQGWTPDLLWAVDSDPPVDDDLDEIAIERACAGDLVGLTRTERLEAVRRLRANGLLATHIATRLHVNGQTVNALLAQLDQADTQEATA